MDNQNKQKPIFMQAFGARLCSTLKKNGQASRAANSGVKVADLANAAGCSKQMARRYVLGEAMPDYLTILNMAKWLNVSPGWLLFGEDERAMAQDHRDDELIAMHPQLLRYILNGTTPLFTSVANKEEVVNFITDIIYDAAHLPPEDRMTKKLIDTAIRSANRFQPSNSREKDVSLDHKKISSFG